MELSRDFILILMGLITVILIWVAILKIRKR